MEKSYLGRFFFVPLKGYAFASASTLLIYLQSSLRSIILCVALAKIVAVYNIKKLNVSDEINS